MFAVKVALLTVLVAVCTAHVCQLSPPQRGSLDGFNKPEADNCFLIKGPCGGRAMSSNPILLRSHQNFTVIFQKNLDHWVAASPGYFSIMWGMADGSGLTEVGRIPDMGEPSLTLYAMNVTIPSTARGQYILQTQYVTKNPDPTVPAIFFQCGDVTLV